MLLNATLTVRAHQANSHSDWGWQKFTDAVVKIIDEKSDHPVVFILWGGFAQKKGKIINRKKHHVIEAAHPSPLSASVKNKRFFNFFDLLLTNNFKNFKRNFLDVEYFLEQIPFWNLKKWNQ